jgi:hypothetical protein
MKEQLVNKILEVGTPRTRKPPEPEKPKDQPYAKGEVHMHLWHSWGCVGGTTDIFSVRVQVWDQSDAFIGTIDRTQASEPAPAFLKSRFEQELKITPKWSIREPGPPFIEFELGDLKFDSKDKERCTVGEFRPRDGPQCWIDTPNGPMFSPHTIALSEMDCKFTAVGIFIHYHPIYAALVSRPGGGTGILVCFLYLNKNVSDKIYLDKTARMERRRTVRRQQSLCKHQTGYWCRQYP